MKVYEHKILTALMIDVIVYVFRHTHGDKTIMECAIEALDYYDHSLCVLDVDETSALLKSFAVCALGVSRSYALVDTKSVRMQRLHRAAGLMAEVQCAFVLPLRCAFDTSVKTERLSVLRNYLKTAQTTICGHSLSFFWSKIPSACLIGWLIIVET